MTNVITVQMLFHFKGEQYDFSAEIQLPLHLGNMTEFYYSLPRRIAERNGVDTYSYMFDMMESSPIEVISAKGYVARFVENGSISMDEFVAACQEVTPEALLADIAEQMKPSSANSLSIEEGLKLAYEIGLSQGAAE